MIGCNRRFGTRADLQRHEVAFHNISGVVAFRCKVMNCQGYRKVFDKEDELKEHNQIWHGSYLCHEPNCLRGPGNGFKDEAELKAHFELFHAK
jgi:uncharacterized CHY-type Zn-finger protein